MRFMRWLPVREPSWNNALRKKQARSRKASSTFDTTGGETSKTLALAGIPTGLRAALLSEYDQIVQSFLEGRWSPVEMSGGRFCEIVFSILEGLASGNFPSHPKKPPDFVSACRKLESETTLPRSLRILVPRLLPALYEIRNNRGVGHVGGDVDPNFMDASAVVSIANWVLAEMVRVFHGLSADEAQRIVNSLLEFKSPLIWKNGQMRRVLNPSLKLRDQILLLLSSCPAGTKVQTVFNWTGSRDMTYFRELLYKLHGERLLELSEEQADVMLLPPGTNRVRKLLQEHAGLL